MTLLQSAWLRKRINSTDVQKPTKTVFSVFIVGIRYFSAFGFGFLNLGYQL